jgi:hypothetical protein
MMLRTALSIPMHQPVATLATWSRLRAVVSDWCSVLADPMSLLEPEPEVRPLRVSAHVLAITSRASRSSVRAHDGDGTRWRWG